MSSSTAAATTAASAEGSKRNQLVGKYVDKFKKSIRRMSSIREPKPKSPSTATAPATIEATPKSTDAPATATTAAAAAAPPPTETAPTTLPETAPAPEESKVVEASEVQDPEATETEAAKPGLTRAVSGPAYIRSAIQQERARALFAKYGLTLETPDWLATGTPGTVANPQRVEKPIRMRVRRTCHRCNATFGPDRICGKCEHKRCKKCPRFPPKKPKKEVETGKATEGGEKAKVMEGKHRAFTSPGALMAEHKAAGLVTQRIKYSCHKCDTAFAPRTAQGCPACGHLQCARCPKEALKTRLWPPASSWDVQSEESEVDMVQTVQRIYRKPRQRVRWTCDQCSNMFVESSKVCEKCQHKRCDGCMRIPPKRTKKELDPDVVKAVERKLAGLMMSETPAVS